MIRRASLDERPSVIALQHAAYAQNRAILGVEPIPLAADYAAIFAQHECWVADNGGGIDGALFLEMRPDDLLIWSIATHPRARSTGTGKALLAFADKRASETGRNALRLYTGELLTANIAWYARNGFTIERTEQMSDRRVVHMKKSLEEKT